MAKVLSQLLFPNKRCSRSSFFGNTPKFLEADHLYLFGGKSVSAFYLGIAIVDVFLGTFMVTFPDFTADQFSAKKNSVNFGNMFIGFTLAGFFDTTVMRLVLARNEI